MPCKKHHRAHSRLRSLLPRPMLGQVLLDWQGEPPVVAQERGVEVDAIGGVAMLTAVRVCGMNRSPSCAAIS